MSDAERSCRLSERDVEARRRACSEFERPVALEAGAGTGKTTALVTRVLAWALGPGWERAVAAVEERQGAAPRADRIASQVLERVVAITFTEAAAAEMSTRVADALREVEAGKPPDWLPADALPTDPAVCSERALALRGALDHLIVQTIHAYCRRLLVTHPLEAGLHPQLEIDAEGRRQAEVVREVCEEQLSRAYLEPGEPGILALAEGGVGPQQIEDEVLALLDAGVSADALRSDPLSDARVVALHDRVRAALEAFAAAAQGALHGVARNPTAVRVARAIDATIEELRANPWSDAAALEDGVARLRERWDESARTRLGQWAGGDFLVTEQAAIGSRDEAIAAAAAGLVPLVSHLCSLDVARLAVARPVLLELLSETEARLRARGVATFSALLSETRDLLRGRPAVAARVRSRIDQLLVDEFQDTDRRQCDIVRAIALEGPPAQRPGLFLVGDPKQSIYGWRSADLAAYEAFVQDVEALGGERGRLSVNHRSAPRILEEVERVIAPVMLEQEGLQPAFQPLIPSERTRLQEGFRLGGSAPTECWVSASWDGDPAAPQPTRTGEAALIEARVLARDLRRLHDEHDVAWQAVGVLFRGRGDFEIYLGALRTAGIPFAVEGDRRYYQRREIIEASALVRCVLDPNDHLALLTLLRSAAVGVPDAALIPLWVRRIPSRLGALHGAAPDALGELRVLLDEVVASLPGDVPGLERVAGWEENLLAVAEALALLRHAYRCEAADVFVERLRSLTLFEVTEAARFLGAWRNANLDRFFRELTDELDGDGGAHAALRRLRSAVADEEQQEEGRPKDVVEDAVRIMTIHGAKGLDFEHVYLMQLHKGSGRGGFGGVDAGEIDDVVEYRLFDAATPGWDRVARERETVSDAEQVRMLYVAMTRAKRRLVLAGVWPDFQKSGSSGPAMKLLEEGRGLPPGIVERVGAADRAEADGTLWVFPGREAGADTAASEERADREGLPTAEQVRAASRSLASARQRARQRMERPLSGRASEQAHGSGAFASSSHGAGDESRMAMAIGTAIHRVLENLDFEAAAGARRERADALLAIALGEAAPPERFEEALTRARAMFERITGGALYAKLRSLAAQIVARELPVLVPPTGDTGPAAYLSGMIDLVYRDPDSGQLVVADYKTDRVDDEAVLQERTAAYALQGAVYQRAVQEAFGLPYTPRFELWYLAADRIVQALQAAGNGPDPARPEVHRQ